MSDFLQLIERLVALIPLVGFMLAVAAMFVPLAAVIIILPFALILLDEDPEAFGIVILLVLTLLLVF